LIGERIGGGGMAEVYRSTLIGVEGFTRTVAVKRILGNFSADTTFAEMFVNEANIASLLTHPNIVSVLDFDRDDSGQLFLVMELVEGCDLKQLADEGSLPVELSTFVTGEVMRALSFAHSLEREGRSLAIVHRDISPHNVLVSWDGAVKLSDFGIAKATEATRVTQTGLIKGKVSYMSPEQVEGLDLDSRSDLFSAGILLHELLTGRRLFDGPSDRAVLNRILIGDIAPPSATNPEVPPALDRICMRLLERELERRYQRAQDVIEDLLLTNLISPRAQFDLARLMKERRFDRRGRTSPPTDPWADELRTDPGPGTAAPFVSAPTLEKPDIDFASPADPRTNTAVDRPRPLDQPDRSPDGAATAPRADTKASGLPSLDVRGGNTDRALDPSARSAPPAIDSGTESTGAAFDRSRRSAEPMSDPRTASTDPVFDRSAHSARGMIDAPAESANMIRGRDARSARPTIDPRTESTDPSNESSAGSARRTIDPRTGSTDPVVDRRARSAQPPIDPRAESTDPVLDRSTRPTLDPQAESDERVLDRGVGASVHRSTDASTKSAIIRRARSTPPSAGPDGDPDAQHRIDLDVGRTSPGSLLSGDRDAPSRGRSKGGRAAIVVGVLLLLAGAAVVGPRLRLYPDAPVAAPLAPPPPAPPPPAVALPAVHRVRITSEPSGAAVHLEGAADPSGTTPFELDVRPGENRPIELRLAGHRSAFHELRSEDLHVELAKLPVPKKRKKRTRDGILPPEKQIGDGILRPNL
jgi:serine/threonine protein kinase